MYEDNLDYARQRLLKTLVRVGKDPFFVETISARGVVQGILISEDEDTIAEVKMKDLNLEPVPLGFVNINKDVVFAVRKPMRRDWRQGLRLGNMAFLTRQGFDRFPFRQLRNTILNNYPSLHDIKHIHLKTCKRVAFSRNFALDREGQLWYKGDNIVGRYDNLFELDPQYKYLNEHLQEVAYA
jgi:hypothetical protein